MSGKLARLRRIFQADERAVVVALDHGQFKHAATGLEDIKGIISTVVDGGADGVILNPGPALSPPDRNGGAGRHTGSRRCAGNGLHRR